MHRLAIFTALLTLAGSCRAQDLVSRELLEAPRFGESNYFRRHFAEPTPRVELQPVLRLSDFAVGGKLELSLRSYLELVMVNNTDIQIQKLTVEVQHNAITRAFASFDPTVTTSFRATRSTRPTQDALAGAAVLKELSQPLNFSYQQTLESGTQYNVGFSGSKSSTNNAFATFNPALAANMQFTVTQPLLRNRGTYVNRIPMMIARTRYRAGLYNLEDQLMRLLQQAELAYWAVIESREALRVQEQALDLADQILKRNQRELELGAISPLDIYQPQQNYANQEIRVTQARYRLEQTEDAMRRQIGADIDPDFRLMPLVLTETVLPPADDSGFDREELVETAYRKRPDLKEEKQSMEIAELNMRQAKNSLLPDLSLQAGYTAAGRGGPFFERQNVFAGDGTRSTVSRIVPGGIGDAMDQILGFDFPVYNFALTLRLPIRDRRAAADLADATVNRKLSALRARNAQQQIRLEVLNAINQVENSRAGVRLAQVSLDFSQKRVDAEQKKYDLGVTTIFFLLDAQNALSQAQANLVTQSVQYRRNLLSLLRTTGQLLEERGVAVQ